MSKFAAILSDLRNADRYVRVPGVDIFDEHAEYYYEDEDGHPVPKGTRGARKRKRVFKREDLERIANNCNKRDRTGSLSPLTLGHTDPEEPDERKQPVPVGYALNYRVRFDNDRNKHMLVADYYIRKDKYDLAKTFPRTSIELWPDDKEEIIDPIALLRRTPQRDLGQWTYSRGRHVLRYSMEFKPMNDELYDDDAMTDEAPVDAPVEDAEPSHEEKVEQFMRHCFSHPHAKYFSGHYGMEEGPEEAPLPEGPEEDPTDMPDADEVPLQNSAMASATNAGVPDHEEPDGDEGMPPAQYKRDQIAILYQKLRKENAALKYQANEAEARRMVAQLVAEGYQLDAGVEVPKLARMNAEQREKHEAHVRKYYRQSPTSKVGRVRTAEPENAQQVNPAHHERAINYIRENGGDYTTALKMTR